MCFLRLFNSYIAIDTKVRRQYIYIFQLYELVICIVLYGSQLIKNLKLVIVLMNLKTQKVKSEGLKLL